METNPTDTPPPDSFGARLAAARRVAGITQAQLGQGLGPEGRDLQKAAVSAWEVGVSSPNSSQLNAICDRLHVSADYLLGREEAAEETVPWNGVERRAVPRTAPTSNDKASA